MSVDFKEEHGYEGGRGSSYKIRSGAGLGLLADLALHVQQALFPESDNSYI